MRYVGIIELSGIRLVPRGLTGSKRLKIGTR